MHSALVQDGGLTVLHDRVPAYATRFGIQTASDVRGMPQFRQEVRNAHGDYEEIVRDPLQDRSGIRVIHWKGDRNA